jgi:RNA polymerase sigma factor
MWREVQYAFAEHKTIIPLRIEDVEVGEDLGFYLSGVHWRDALPDQPFYEELLTDVSRALNTPTQNEISPEQSTIHNRVNEAKNNGLAADALIKDYLPFIKSEASKTAGRAVTEHDHEFSIAMMGFNEAIESYSETRGAFLKYASVVIQRKLIDNYRKEKRHTGQVSIYESISADSEMTLADTVQDEADTYDDINIREATKQEIAELTQQLRGLELSLTDIADNCPKQDRTLESCRKALFYARENPELIAIMKRTKKLPIAALAEGSGVERKTLERHRKYIMALLLIYSNGYEIIRGHLKQVMPVKGGARV